MNIEFFSQVSWRKIRIVSGFIVSINYAVTSCRLQKYQSYLTNDKGLSWPAFPPGHLVSPLACRGPWMSTSVLYCWCHSDSASVLLYFTCKGMIQAYSFWSFNVSASQTFRYKILLFEFPLLKLYRSVCGNIKFLNNLNIDVSPLPMSPLRAIVICQKYCGNRVISSHLLLLYLTCGVVLCDIILLKILTRQLLPIKVKPSKI